MNLMRGCELIRSNRGSITRNADRRVSLGGLEGEKNGVSQYILSTSRRQHRRKIK